VKNFAKHHMTRNEILAVFTRTFTGPDNTPKSLTDLARCEVFSDSYQLLSQIEDEICLEFFTDHEIGPKAPPHKVLNKRIAQEVFGHQVAIQDKWIYSETGDYTVLEAQEALEVYSDGSGCYWDTLRNFSGDIQKAWDLVAELTKKGFQVQVTSPTTNDQPWTCTLQVNQKVVAQAQGPTAMEAICIAALEPLAQ
jgi:hypothetical protein